MRRDPIIALKAAGLGILGIVVMWLLAFYVGPAQDLDQRISGGFTGLYSARLETFTRWVPHLSDPQPFVLWFVLIVGVALWRGRPRLAIVVAVILIGSSMATALLKSELTIVRFTQYAQVGPNAFPSGHATASMAVALCAILVAPSARRPLVAALGAVYTLAVTFTLLVASWHFPSDVFAGYLMAGTWTSLGVAALWWREARVPSSTPAGEPERATVDVWAAIRPVAVVLAAAIGFALLVLIARPDAVVDYARAHTTFIVGAAVIAALALALVGFLAAATTNAPRSREP
jgi:membrane-associated phospholipid phosphatase